MDNSESKIVTP
jgi:deoxyhypusine synthase